MKKRILLTGLLITLKLTGWAQDKPLDSIKTNEEQTNLNSSSIVNSPYIFNDGYDRLIKLNKDTLVVKIQKITQSEIVFKYPLNNISNRIPVFHIKEILSKEAQFTTTFKTLNMPVKKVAKDTLAFTDIKNIVVTYNNADVSGLTEIGNIESRSEGESASSSTSMMEKNATFQLQKKAALLGATKVLVTDKKIDTPYGENPTVEMKGIAYK